MLFATEPYDPKAALESNSSSSTSSITGSSTGASASRTATADLSDPLAGARDAVAAAYLEARAAAAAAAAAEPSTATATATGTATAGAVRRGGGVMSPLLESSGAEEEDEDEASAAGAAGAAGAGGAGGGSWSAGPARGSVTNYAQNVDGEVWSLGQLARELGPERFR